MFVLIRALVTLVLIYSVYGNPIGDHNTKNLGITGGYNISIQEAPYVVSLVKNGEHWCGGSIVHKQFILTAAHCIRPGAKYKVRAGATYVDKGGQLYDVEKIITHENYSHITKDYDICLIKLNNTIKYGPRVKKIKITGHDVLRKGAMLKLSGWGSKGTYHYNMLECLQQVSIPVVSRSSCEKIYSDLTPRMLCVGEPGKDACWGDSGGPLTWNNIQVGVTSFGKGCGNYPGVYTKISTLRKWIKQTIEENL